MEFGELRLVTLSRPLFIEIAGLPPSANKQTRFGNGRFYKPVEVSGWQNRAIVEIRKRAREVYSTYDLSRLTGYPFQFTLSVQRSRWRQKAKARSHLFVAPDLDNFIKPTLDAVKCALDIDDRSVVEILLKKVEGPGPDQTFMKLQFLEGI